MKKDYVIVAMHGYSLNVPPGYRPWEEVVRDRLNATLRVAEFFRKLGCEVEIVIAGGTVYEGKNEAEAIKEYAEQNFPEIKNFEVTLEKYSKNTTENVNNILKIAKERGSRAIVAVSSKDHMARVVNEYVYNPERPKVEETIIFGCPSNEPYSEAGKTIRPAIVEPPVKFGEHYLAELVPKFFKVPKEKRGEFAKDLEDLLNKYL